MCECARVYVKQNIDSRHTIKRQMWAEYNQTMQHEDVVCTLQEAPSYPPGFFFTYLMSTAAKGKLETKHIVQKQYNARRLLLGAQIE